MNNKVANTQNNVFALLVSLWLTATFLPIFGTEGYSVLMGLIIVWGLLMQPKIWGSRPFLYMTIFVAIEVLYSFLGKGLNIRMVTYYALFFFASIVASMNMSSFTKKQTRFVFILLLVLLSYTFITTFIAIQSDNMIIRNNAYSRDDQYAGSSLFGIYSYGVGEALCIVFPALTIFALRTRNRIFQIALFVLIVLGIITEFQASLTTSSLLSLTFCLIVILSSLVAVRNRLNLLVTIVLIGLIAILILPSTSIGENTAFLLKMEDVNESYATGRSVGQVEGRATLYMQSIKVCAHNPIFGLGDEGPTEFGTYSDNAVSMHTTIFDYWGMYGLFVIFLFLSWKEIIKKIFYPLPAVHKRTYKWSYYTLFFLLLFKGPVTIGINFLFSTVVVAVICLNDIIRDSKAVKTNE